MRHSSGYLHPAYAQSFSAVGRLRLLPASEGWLLERQIPGSDLRDAIGCYPLFCCQNWSSLHSDLNDLRGKVVAVSLVADPFGRYRMEQLEQCFDLILPFKQHYIVDLCRPLQEISSSHHRYYARKALRTLSVPVSTRPQEHLDEWIDLYSNLVGRHQIRGLRRFSREQLRQQLGIPGAVMIRAIHGRTAVAAQVWYQQNEVGYSHLTAASELGYALRATYALYSRAIEYFSARTRWLDLGAGAGLEGDEGDGLSRFKRGWATGRRTAYLCGRIFDHSAYDDLVRMGGLTRNSYFPAYRAGDFE
jgi:hypothetical protein